MKKKILIIATLVMIFSIGISSTAEAHPGWHGRGGWGWCGPRVRVVVPPVVVGGGYYGDYYGGGGYYRPYYDRGCYRPAPRYYGYYRPHYDRDRGYGRGWRR